MELLLHAGHEHTETAATTASTEQMGLIVVGLLGLILVAAYVVRRYSTAKSSLD